MLQKIGNFIPEHDIVISQKMKNVKINQFWLTLIGKLLWDFFSERRRKFRLSIPVI